MKIIAVQRGREFKLRDELEKGGIECFLPSRIVKKRVNRRSNKKRTVEELVIRRIAFADFDGNQLEKFRNVRYVWRKDGDWIEVNEFEVRRFMDAIQEISKIRVGDRIKVDFGVDLFMRVEEIREDGVYGFLLREESPLFPTFLKNPYIDN